MEYVCLTCVYFDGELYKPGDLLVISQKELVLMSDELAQSLVKNSPVEPVYIAPVAPATTIDKELAPAKASRVKQ